MDWIVTYRTDPDASKFADRHYNRQSHGARDFVPPGKNIILRTENMDALWAIIWQNAEFVDHEWKGAWNNCIFRNESDRLSSELILDAVAACRAIWPEVPEQGLVTFVDQTAVRSTNPGFCYKCAGFEHVGYTKVNKLHAFRMLPEQMPEPELPEQCVAPIGTVAQRQWEGRKPLGELPLFKGFGMTFPQEET